MAAYHGRRRLDMPSGAASPNQRNLGRLSVAVHFAARCARALGQLWLATMPRTRQPPFDSGLGFHVASLDVFAPAGPTSVRFALAMAEHQRRHQQNYEVAVWCPRRGDDRGRPEAADRV